MRKKYFYFQKINFLALAFLILSVSWLRVQGQQSAKLFDGTNAYVKGYMEHLPDDYYSNPTQKYPVLIFLHGIGETGNGTSDINRVTVNGPPQLIATGAWPASFTVGGTAYKFLVISPQSSIGWQATDVGYLIDQLPAIYGSRIDQSRIYLTGLSSGGGGVWEYLAASVTNGKKIAAAMICCGASYWGDQSRVNTIVQASVPIWAFHNELDPTVPSSQSVTWVQNLNSSGINPAAKLTIYPGVYSHNCWSAAYDPNPSNPNKAYEWLLSNSRSTVPIPAPVASAGQNQTITLPGIATLDGTASTAPGGSITGYFWTKVSGPTGDQIQWAYGAKTTVSFTQAGTYSYQLAVTNNFSLTNSATVTISVAPLVSPLVVSAGSNQSIVLPTPANLDGSGSTIPTGAVPAYTWTKQSGPAGERILSPSAIKTAVDLAQPGNYTFQLKVVNQANGVASSASVQVNASAPPPPVTSNDSSTFVHFSNNTAAVISPWINTGWDINAGASVPLKDQNGLNSGTLSFLKPWSGAASAGVNTGNNSGVYPDAILQSGFAWGNSDSAVIQVANLDRSRLYNFSFLGSWSSPWAGTVSNYSIGSLKASLDAANNSTRVAHIDGVAPDNNGIVQIKIAKDPYSGLAWLNALVFKSVARGTQSLSPSSLLVARGLTTATIRLDWTNSLGTLKNYIFRATNSYGPFVLVDSVGSGVSTYLDKGLSQNTGYFYQVTAASMSARSTPSNLAFASTLLFSVQLTFNTDQPAPWPWNNTNSAPYVGFSLYGLANTAGQNSGINFTVLRNFSGTTNLGSVTWINSGIFPDKAIRGQYVIQSSDSAVVRFSNLSSANSYDLVFFNSWESAWISGLTNFSIGNKTVSLDPNNNHTRTAQISNVIPDAGGNISITVKASKDALYGIINAVVLQAHAVPPYSPNITLSVDPRLASSINPGLINQALSKPMITGVEVYPNPFTDQLSLSLQSVASGEYRIAIYDILGREVFAEGSQILQIGRNFKALNGSIAGLRAGVYMLKIKSKAFPEKVVRILKN